MHYQLKLIKVTSSSGVERVLQSTEAAETGLAYNKTETGHYYTLTHIASGRRLTMDEVQEEQLARLWLEEVATMTDWTADIESIQADLCKKHQTANIQGLIQSALQRAADRHLEELVQAQAQKDMNHRFWLHISDNNENTICDIFCGDLNELLANILANAEHDNAVSIAVCEPSQWGKEGRKIGYSGSYFNGNHKEEGVDMLDNFTSAGQGQDLHTTLNQLAKAQQAEKGEAAFPPIS